jgi:hypothetical protein
MPGRGFVGFPTNPTCYDADREPFSDYSVDSPISYSQ